MILAIRVYTTQPKKYLLNVFCHPEGKSYKLDNAWIIPLLQKKKKKLKVSSRDRSICRRLSHLDSRKKKNYKVPSQLCWLVGRNVSKAELQLRIGSVYHNTQRNIRSAAICYIHMYICMCVLQSIAPMNDGLMMSPYQHGPPPVASSTSSSSSSSQSHLTPMPY